MEINKTKLERERKRLKLTQQAFAAFLDILPSTYTYIIQNKTSKLATIQKIADKLEIDAKDLLI